MAEELRIAEQDQSANIPTNTNGNTDQAVDKKSTTYNMVSSPSLPSNGFEYKPAAAFFPTPNPEDFKVGVGKEYMDYLTEVDRMTSNYTPISLPRNPNDILPGNATGRYNPVDQALPDRMSSEDKIKLELKNIVNRNTYEGYVAEQERGNIANISPIHFSRKASRFDRYYKHPKFDQIGFHPYVDNESYYNANSSVWDDASRMLVQAGNQFGSAFVSTYRSMGDIFQGQNYITNPDTETAEAFMSATDIGMSSRGGVAGFANNLVLNSAYTFGIIGNILVEELALGALTSVTGGAAAPALAASTATIPSKLKNLFSLTRFGSASKNLVKNLDDVNKAKDFWGRTQAGRDFIGDIFLPNTTAAVRNSRTAANTADNAMNMAKSRPLAIDLYSDFRDLNFAVAEAKLEGGIVYEEQLNRNISEIMQREESNTLTPELMEEAATGARNAAFYTSLLNAPFIYFSNKIVLGPALRGFRGSRFFKETFEEGAGLFGKRIVRQSSGKQVAKQGGKEAGNIFVDVGEGFGSGFNRLKTLGFAGSARKFAQGSLRYFAANVTEGVQELYQEAISAGTQDYYTTLIKDPSATHKFAYSNAISSGISSQFSAQGVETFLSGFLMGGLVQGPQRVLFSSIPNAYQRYFNKEEYENMQKQKEEYVSASLKAANEMASNIGIDATSPFDMNDLHMFAMNQGAQSINNSDLAGDKLSFYNNQDFTKFQQIHRAIVNGTSSEMKQYVSELLNLSDEDVNAMYKLENTPDNATNTRNKLQSVINDISSAEKNYEASKDKIVNNFDPSKYKEGTKEYDNELRSYAAMEHIKYLYAFTGETFRKSVDRFNSIYASLQTDPILKNIQASDLTLLLDPSSVNAEIETLILEIASLEGDKDSKADLEFKKKKLETLQEFGKVLQDPNNLKADETFNRRLEYVKKLRQPFLNYVRLLADSRNDFVNINEIDNALQKIVDYGYLQGTAKQYMKAMEFMINPQVIEDLRERTAGFYGFLNENREELVKALINQHVTDANVNALFNKLFELGVVTDIQETKKFLETLDKNELNIFYGEKELVNAINDPELYSKIMYALNQFETLQKNLNPETKTEEVQEEIDTTLTAKENFLENNNLKEYNLVQYKDRKGNELLILKNLLEHQYRKYKNEQNTLGKTAINYNEWLNSEKYGSKIIFAHDLLKQIYANELAAMSPKELGIVFSTEQELEKFLNSDRGFVKWLSNKTTKSNALVKEALNQAGVSYNEMFIQPPKGASNNTISQTALGSLVKINVEGETLYTILDSNGQRLSPEILERSQIDPSGYYTSLQEAKDAFKNYNSTFKPSTPWNFADQIISTGQVIVRKSDGAKFEIYSSARDNGVKEKIYIIPIDVAASDLQTKERSKIPVTRTQMSGYSLETYDNTIKEKAKIVSFDVIEVYPKDRGESASREENEQRVKLVFAVLTQKQLGKVVITVKKNPKAKEEKTSELKDYTIERDGEVLENNQIKKKGEEYSIEIKITDKGSQKNINEALEKEGLPVYDFKKDGGIGFIPNTTYEFTDSAGNKVDPRSMTEETARQIFTEKTGSLEDIHKNFGIQAALLTAIKAGKPGTYKLSALGKGLKFEILSNRKYSADKSRRTAASLKFNTVDGTTVIYRKTGTNSIPYTNLDDAGQQKDFLDKLEQELKDNGLWDDVSSPSKDLAELLLIVRLPGGKLMYLPFDFKPMTDNRFNELMQEAVKESIRIRGKYNAQQLKAGDAQSEVNQFNTLIKNRLFIRFKQNTGGKLSLEINPYTGLVQLNLFRGKNVKDVKITIQDESSYNLSGEEFGIELLKQANNSKDFTDVTGTLTKENFREDIPREGVDLSTEEILQRATTAVAPEVIEPIYINITADSSAIQEALNVSSATNNLPANEGPKQEVSEKDAQETSEQADDTKDISQRETPKKVEEVVTIKVKESPGVLSKLKNTEIAKIARNTNNEATKFLGKLISKTSTNVEGGRAEQEVYEYGVVQRIFANDGSKVQRVTDHNGKVYGVPLINLTMDAKEAGLLFDGQKGFSLTEKQITEFFNSKFAESSEKVPQKVEVAEEDQALLKEKLADIQVKIQQRKLELFSEGTEAMANDETLAGYQKIYEELNEKLYGDAANKILDGSLTYEDVTDIDEFIEWAKTVLPDFISVADINQLGSNLRKGGIRVGAFMMSLKGVGQGVEGNIYTGASNPFKYHEAFHAVFRMLLTDEQIDQYLRIGKRELLAKLKAEGKTLKGELQRLKNSAAIYERMGDAKLEQELIEEYLADRFEEFKTDRKSTKTDSIIKTFFNKLIELIRSVFKAYTPNQLNTLFESIDAGKFKDSSTQLNRFTKVAYNGVTVEADKLIPVDMLGNAKSGPTRYLDSTVAKQLIADMAANYIDRYQKQPAPIDVNDLLDKVVSDFQSLYSTTNPANASLTDKQKLTLIDLDIAFNTYSDSIKESVKDYLGLFKLQVQDTQDNADQKFDDEGDRTVDQWDKSQELIGGIRSLPLFIRRYIATTTLSEKDIFGRASVINGASYSTTVEAGKAYSGLVKSAKNTSDNLEMLRNMVQFAQSNPHTKAVMDRFLNDVGLSTEAVMQEDFSLSSVKNPILFQKFVAAFQNYVVDNRIIQRDSKTGKVRIFSAGNRDDARNQVNIWANGFNERRTKMDNDPSFKQDALRAIGTILPYLKSSKTITDETLNSFAVDVSDKLITYAGISLNPEYIKFSILQNIAAPTKNQQAIIDNNVGAPALSSEDIQELVTEIDKGLYIFDSGNEGMQGRIIKLADGNALFDENIFLSTFKNAEDNLVHAHQSPTFHLQKLNELNSSEVQDNLLKAKQLAKNTLLNEAAFKQMGEQGLLKILRLNGITNRPFDRVTADTVVEQSVYGKLGSKQFMASLINMYLTGVEDNTGSVKSVGDKALAASLIRVIEASNTGDFVMLPVMKTIIESGEMTTEAVQHFRNAIETEFNRIKDVISSQDKPGEPVIKGYNTEGGRGFTFFNTGLYMDPAVKTSLEELLKGKTAEELKDLDLKTALKESGSSLTQVIRGIKISINQQFTEFRSEVPTDLIASTITTATNNTQTNTRLNLVANNLDHNLKQIFISSLINTEAINDILLGDQALSLKDAVDQVKRAKMQNAAGKSAKHDIIAPEYGINEPLSKFELVVLSEMVAESLHSGENIDVADAQMYMTVKAFGHMFFGFGKLTEQQARLLDQVEQGTSISTKELYGNIETGEEGYAQLQAMLNSKKVVYGDGQTFLKTSAFVLSPALTSTKKSGYGQAKPNKVKLHNLRVKLEAIEQDKSREGTIAVAVPESASKMLTQNINDFNKAVSEEGVLQSTTLDADFLRLQVVNPSNKTEVTDMTQLKTLITSEQTTKNNKTKDQKNITIDGVQYSVSDLVKSYQDLTSARITSTFRQRRNLVVDFSMENAMDTLAKAKKDGQGAVSVDLWSFAQYAVSSLQASNSSSGIIEMFTTVDGQMKYDPNNPISIDKFEQLFFAFFSQSLREKLPGDKVTMVSDFGHYVYRRVFSVDENGNPDRQEVIRESAAEKQGLEPINLDTPDNISMLADALAEAGSEGVVILDRLRPNIKEYKDGKFTGVIYSEALMPTTDSSAYSIIDVTGENIPEVLSKMVGTRIPTQDKHSALAIRVVDFMPAYYGSVGVFPREMVEVAGSDFDVDAVYLHKKQFYTDGKNFLEYGKESTAKGRFFSYQTYLNAEVKKSGSSLARASSKFNSNVAQIKETKVDKDIRRTLGVLTKDAYNAAAMLGMPTTFEEFLAYEKSNGTSPSIAEVNNRLLDVKFGLLGNEYITNTPGLDVAIAFQPAGVTKLKEFAKILSDTYPSVAAATREDNVNVNSISGKTSSFKNNKEGAGNIGAAVIPNQILSLLKEFGGQLKKPIKINGILYSDLSSQFQRDSKTGEENVGGIRNQYLISELVTAMTDNAKERLAAKLNLTKEGLSILTATTALGIDYKVVLSFLATPEIRGVLSEVKENDGVSIREAVRRKATKGIKFKGDKVTSQMINKALLNESTSDISNSLYGLLLNLSKLSGEVLNYSRVISLSKGLGPNVEGLMNLDNAIRKINDKKNDYLKPSDFLELSYFNAYLQSVEEIKEIAKQVLYTASESAQVSLNDFRKTMPGATEAQRVKFKRDLVSHMTLLEYMGVLANSTNKRNAASLTNDYLYSVDPNFNPAKTIEELRRRRNEILELRDKPNYFLDRFVVPQRITDATNKTGLSLIAANTFNQLTDSQKVDLQNSILVLFNNPATSSLVKDIIHYIMVKDGLQYNFGGLLDAIPVSLLDEFNQSVANLKNKEDRNDKMPKSYYTSATVARNLKTLDKFRAKPVLFEDFPDGSGIGSLGFLGEDAMIPQAFRRQADEFDIDGAPDTYYVLENLTTTIDPLTGDVRHNALYAKFEPMGSADQNGIGFIFNSEGSTRPSQRDLIRLGRISRSEPQLASPTLEDMNQEQQEMLDALSDPNVQIDATNKTINTTERPSIVEETTDDVSPIEESAEEVQELEDPIGDAQAGEQMSLFDSPESVLKKQWAELSAGQNKAKLQKVGLKSYADFVKFIGQYETEQEAIDHIKECYL